MGEGRSGKDSHSGIALALTLLALGTVPLPAKAADVSFVLSEPAGEDVVFNWYTDRCDKDDLPDMSARAIRDFRRAIHLFASNDHNREAIGPDFAHLHHSCASAFQGRHADDPARFDDRQWLTSFVTSNGRRVLSVVHEEFHGQLRPSVCASRTYLSCWENALTFAYSDDGGYSFRQPAPPNDVIATLPYPYRGDIGHPVGYFQPTNIVRNGGFYYMLFLATGFRAQQHGICVARTADPADPKSWRAWDGSGFTVRFANPYAGKLADPDAHVCAPVGKGSLFDIGSVSQDSVSGRFVMVTMLPKQIANRGHPSGAYVATSADLIHWSGPVLLASEAALGAKDRPGRFSYGFVSLIDQDSPAADFSTISASPRLYLYYVKLNSMNAPLARVLVRRRVTVQRQ